MTSRVTIGIPTLNGPARLLRCLESIFKHTPLKELGAEVLVSDDFSYEKELAENKKICKNLGVEILTAPDRLGVAQQWNRLTRHTSTPCMILMNDDVEVTPDWLEALLFSLERNPSVGMVGLKAYQGVNSENFTVPPAHSYNEAVMEHGQGMVASTGFLFGFHRTKFDQIEGFDPSFFAFYEEVDFGIRLLQIGSPSYMLSYPVVIHQGGATTSETRNIDAKKVLAESREKFIRKHGRLSLLRDQLMGSSEPLPRTVHWNTLLKVWTD
jgi:GT2 family glycosyltransferase